MTNDSPSSSILNIRRDDVVVVVVMVAGHNIGIDTPASLLPLDDDDDGAFDRSVDDARNRSEPPPPPRMMMPKESFGRQYDRLGGGGGMSVMDGVLLGCGLTTGEILAWFAKLANPPASTLNFPSVEGELAGK